MTGSRHGLSRCEPTEPHMHLQAMDRASVWFAAGLPIRFRGAAPPPNGEPLATDALATDALATDVLATDALPLSSR